MNVRLVQQREEKSSRNKPWRNRKVLCAESLSLIKTSWELSDTPYTINFWIRKLHLCALDHTNSTITNRCTQEKWKANFFFPQINKSGYQTEGKTNQMEKRKRCLSTCICCAWPRQATHEMSERDSLWVWQTVVAHWAPSRASAMCAHCWSCPWPYIAMAVPWLATQRNAINTTTHSKIWKKKVPF